MRSRLDDNVVERAQFLTWRLNSSRLVLSADYTLPALGPVVSFFDASGANRTVTLDSYVKDTVLFVANIGASNSILINDPNAALLSTLAAGEGAWLFCSGDDWIVVKGGSLVTGLQNIVEDLTPQLGGDLDLNGFNILGLENVDNTSDLDKPISTATQAALDLKQNLSANLSAIAGQTWAADKFTYYTAAATAALGDLTAFGRSLLDDADASAGRATLGLVIGTDVQAFNANLAAIAGQTWAADRFTYYTGAATAALGTITAFGRSLIDDADAAAGRATLGVVIGTDVQAYNANLNAIAGQTWAADRFTYYTAPATAALGTITAFGRSLIDDADAAAGRATLGLVIGTDVQPYDANTAKLNVAQTFSAKQTFGTTTKLQQALEKVTITAGAPASTQNFDALTQAIQYFTSNNANNWTLNVRGDGSNSLDSIMAIGEALTIAIIVTNGGTAYRQTAMQIDGSSVTPQWLGAAAPTAGTINKRDTYTFTIIKTSSATFIVQASFAAGN